MPEDQVTMMWEEHVKPYAPWKNEDGTEDENGNSDDEEDASVFNHNLDLYIQYLEFTFLGSFNNRTGKRKNP